MEPLSCAIIDDEVEAINRLRFLLNKVEGITIKFSTTDPIIAVKNAIEVNPDILFIDIEMSPQSGFEFASHIKKKGVNSKIVFTTAYSQYAIKAIKINACDYLLKPIDLDELKCCILKIQQSLNHSINSTVTNLCMCLSDREKEVFSLVIAGYKSAEVAEQLNITKHTVDFHRKKILEKTGFESFLKLVTCVS